MKMANLERNVLRELRFSSAFAFRVLIAGRSKGLLSGDRSCRKTDNFLVQADLTNYTEDTSAALEVCFI